MKKTQLNWVRTQLLTKGKVTRNQALRMYITRLSAYIYDLRFGEGLKIEGSWKVTKNGRDYVYTIVDNSF